MTSAPPVQSALDFEAPIEPQTASAVTAAPALRVAAAPAAAAAPALSKSRVMAFRQCPKRLWLQANRRQLAKYDAASQARIAAGNRIGELARTLRPGGTLIGHPDDVERALADTREQLATSGDLVLFEAAIRHDTVAIRADVLERREGRYRLVEVKSGASVKDRYLQDLAIQAWTVQRAGLPLERASIAHVDTAFIYAGDGDYRGLMQEADVTNRLQPLIEQVPAWVAGGSAVLATHMPDVEVGAQCAQPYRCEFHDWCHRAEPMYPVTILPSGKRLAGELRAEGIRQVADVPESRLANALQAKVWRVSRTGEAELAGAAAAQLRALPWPRAFLDFETVAPAVPIWAGTRAFQRMPIQWSLHVEASPGRLISQGRLIAHGADPRREFAESLLGALPADGPVFVYNAPFEGGVLQELAIAFPDLGDALSRVKSRIVDLLPIAREHYYHPAMKGSWSLKAVLPTIAPELDYARLEGAVRSGSDVEAVYAEIIDAHTESARRFELESALLRYCERDTFALTRLLAFLQGSETAPPS